MTELHAGIEDDVITVGFFEDPDHYLLLQRGLSPDEQDISLGLDGVYIEVNDQRYSSYDGISRFVIGNGFAEVHLEGETVRDLETESIQITFPENDPLLTGMMLHLRQLFEKEPGVLVSLP